MRQLRRRWLLPVVVLVADAVLLFGAVALGLRIPGLQHLAGLPRSSGPDYADVHSPVQPLRPGFVTAALGPTREMPTTASADAASPASALTALLRPPGVAGGNTAIVAVGDNDAFGSAARITAVPWAGRTNTNGATRQPGEPNSCSPVGGTVWFRYDAPAAERLRASASAGTSTALAAYEGSSLSDLRQIGCTVSPTGNPSLIVSTLPDHTYFFQLDRPAGGTVVFHLEPQSSLALASVTSAGQVPCGDIAGAVPDTSRCGRAGSMWASVSADGRWVAFDSDQPLVAERPQAYCTGANCTDVYVRDMVLNRTMFASVSSRGVVGNDSSIIGFGPSGISADGRYVTFWSLASNLVPHDTNQCSLDWLQYYKVPGNGYSCPDAFVHDLVTGRTERVSVSSRGTQADGPSFDPAISPDGRYVAFLSFATNIVPGAPMTPCRTAGYYTDGHQPGPPPTSPCPGIYLHDRATGHTERIDVNAAGAPGTVESSTAPDGYTLPMVPLQQRLAISRGGRYVAFVSAADNLTPHDTNGAYDVFVRDRLRHRTTRVSLDPRGRQFAQAYGPALTPDGRYVVFSGDAAQDPGTRCNSDPQDTGHCPRVYIRDLHHATTRPVDVADNGGAPNDYGGWGSATADGRYVVFFSAASNLTDDDNNSAVDVQCDTGGSLYSEPGTGCTPADVFIRDMAARPGAPGAMVQVSRTPDGQSPHGSSWLASITANGRYVVFESWAPMVPADTNRYGDIYVYDRGAPLHQQRGRMREGLE